MARFWNLETRRPTGKFLEHQGSVEDVAYSPDGARVLTGSAKGEAYLWSAATGERLGPPLGSRARSVVDVAYGPSGKRVLVIDELWELPQRSLGAVEDPDTWVRAVTGMEMNESGAFLWLDRETWLECRRKVGRPLDTE